MHFLEHFHTKTLKYELLNKFFYKSTKKLPTLKKIVLNFGCKTNDSKSLISSLLALKLITNQKGVLTAANKSNITLKIKKGNPVGCKITLRNKQMFWFLTETIVQIFPKIKNFDGFVFNQKSKTKFFSFQIHDTLVFPILEKNYYLFNSLPTLKVTLVIEANSKEETLFILKLLQLPFKK